MEPESHYTALHAAEAAFARGDMLEARKLFRVAEVDAESREAKEHCRLRGQAARQGFSNPEWSYKAFSNVRIGFSYSAGRAWIEARILDLPSSAAERMRQEFGFDVEYEPLGRFDDCGEYDPEVCHPEIFVYGDTPLAARRRLQQVCAFLVQLAESGQIDKWELTSFRPGDAFLRRHLKERPPIERIYS